MSPSCLKFAEAHLKEFTDYLSNFNYACGYRIKSYNSSTVRSSSFPLPVVLMYLFEFSIRNGIYTLQVKEPLNFILTKFYM